MSLSLDGLELRLESPSRRVYRTLPYSGNQHTAGSLYLPRSRMLLQLGEWASSSQSGAACALGEQLVRLDWTGSCLLAGPWGELTLLLVSLPGSALQCWNTWDSALLCLQPSSALSSSPKAHTFPYPQEQPSVFALRTASSLSLYCLMFQGNPSVPSQQIGPLTCRQQYLLDLLVCL